MKENFFICLEILFIIIAGIFLGKIIAKGEFTIPFVIVFGLGVGILTFFRPTIGLFVIVFSMLLSPEIAAGVVPGRAITLRLDDFLLILIFFTWFAHIAVFEKKTMSFVSTSINTPVIFYISICLIFTLKGIILGYCNPVKSFFYVLKYIEYFIIFFLTLNIVKTDKAIKYYLFAGLITCIIVTLYAYSLIGKVERVYAPFDYEGGEPASLGGYYLLVYAVLFSFLLHTEQLYLKLIYIGLILFITPPFIKTLSRASYMGFIPMIITMLLLTKKRKLMFGIFILIGIIVFPVIFKGLYIDMINRIKITFTGSSEIPYVPYAGTYELGSKKITDPSALGRIQSWKRILTEKSIKNPLVLLSGYGITGVGFIENQYVLILGEIGLLGLIVFFWIIIRVFKQSLKIYKNTNLLIPQSLSLSLICCLTALLFQSLTTNSFIIVRIMEPFWFLVGIVMVLPQVYKFET